MREPDPYTETLEKIRTMIGRAQPEADIEAALAEAAQRFGGDKDLIRRHALTLYR